MSDNLLDVHIRHTLETADGRMPMEISVQIQTGKIIALTGPSGSGKTTLLRQIAGLSVPQSGRISLGQKLWLDTAGQFHMPPQQRNIGFVFQDYALFPHFTVKENLLYGLKKGDNQQIVPELLDATRLSQLADRKPHQLSGGQQQRVALARALVCQPDLLLLDEPFNALDYRMRTQIQDLMLHFHQQFRFTAILVTHDIGEIFRLADHVILMENGKVARAGAPASLYLPDAGGQEIVFIGKVLSYEVIDARLKINALVAGDLKTFNIPAGEAPALTTGDMFSVQYGEDLLPIIRVITA